jgi:hypothetical protein
MSQDKEAAYAEALRRIRQAELDWRPGPFLFAASFGEATPKMEINVFSKRS